MFHERGDWFVVADDQRSGEQRTFRVDRIEALRAPGVFDEPDDRAAGDRRSGGSPTAGSPG